MDFSDAFRIVNLVVGVVLILGGIGQFFPFGIQKLIVGVYCILFGAGVGLLEFQIPPIVSRYASFMFSFLGRGVFYVFIGSVMAGDHWFNWVAGIIVALVGIAYIVLEFIPSIEPPSNMREAEASSWGAEQI